MDEEYSVEVVKTFVHFFESWNIYRGNRMVNWCPVSLTALSDEEVIMTPRRSKLYTMKYELVDAPGEFLKIATTRPETLMGDVAVAVNPKDPRYKNYVGRKVRRPFPEAEIPVIADDRINKAISARIEASAAGRGQAPRPRLGPFENVLHSSVI